MTTKRATSKEGRGQQTVTTEAAADRSLEAIEEKVVRMKTGFVAPDDMPLGRVGQNHPETAAKLRAMELRALEKSGRLEELRREAALDRSPKEKIIEKLLRQEPGN